DDTARDEGRLDQAGVEAMPAWSLVGIHVADEPRRVAFCFDDYPKRTGGRLLEEPMSLLIGIRKHHGRKAASGLALFQPQLAGNRPLGRQVDDLAFQHNAVRVGEAVRRQPIVHYLDSGWNDYVGPLDLAGVDIDLSRQAILGLLLVNCTN